MHFNDILDKIIERIESCSKLTNETIRKYLGVYKDNKTDFLLFFNQISETPVEDATMLFEKLKEKNFPEIENITQNGSSVGFNLNKRMFFKDVLKMVLESDLNFGENQLGKDKTVVIDYSSPNIAKVFHVGHYRTTILGNFIKNLLKTSSYNVVSLNYLGDWGKQFGLVLLGYEKFGSPEELEKDSLTHLFKIYVKINEEAKNNPEIHDQARNIFREMEEFKNEKYLSTWKHFRELSIKKYKELYQKLNIEFDVYSGESFFYESAKTFADNNTLSQKDEDGSKVIDCGTFGKALIQKSDGTTLYLTRDICSAMDRIKEYNASKLIYVVSSEQDRHFEQLFYCLQMLGYDRSMFEHVNYGYVKGMSTRNGTVHFIEDIIESSSEAIKSRLLKNKDIPSENIDNTALVLAVSTLLIADFSAKRVKGYTFDYEQRANCEKGSGAYLQYAHCRLKSIEENNTQYDISDLSTIDFSIVDAPEVHDAAYKLIWYERILTQCLDDYEPSRIVLYLMDLTKIVNNLVENMRVKDEPEAVAKARLAVLSACRRVIRNGMILLGITPLNKM